MPEQCYLGIDLGAESGRVIAGLFDGRTIRLEQVHRFGNGPVHVADSLRWDVLRLWSEIQSGLTQSAATYRHSIVSAGVDTWGVDFALLGKKDELLGNPYHYRDPRSHGLLNQALSRVPKREIFAATGLQFLEFNSLYQLLAFQQSHPEMLSIAERLLLMPDLFNWLLTGSRVVEFTNATTTQCFDATRGDWAFELLGKFGLPARIFGDVVRPGTLLGKLRPAVAARTNLSRIDVIAPATHDTASAVAAIPTEFTGSTRWAYISSGTWSLMGLEVQTAVMTPRALELNVTNEGGIDGTYRLLKNIMGLWLLQESRRSFERQGRVVEYGELAHQAALAAPFRALVDPDDRDFLAPDDMPTAIRKWCQSTGQSPPETNGQLIRCILESLALKYRLVLGSLEELTGARVEVIHVVGGGSQNELLNQFAANACGRPVIAGPIEATALGNVLVQARTSGEVSTLADIREVVRASSALRQYEPADQAEWQAAYQRFNELLARRAP